MARSAKPVAGIWRLASLNCCTRTVVTSRNRSDFISLLRCQFGKQIFVASATMAMAMAAARSSVIAGLISRARWASDSVMGFLPSLMRPSAESFRLPEAARSCLPHQRAPCSRACRRSCAQFAALEARTRRRGSRKGGSEGGVGGVGFQLPHTLCH